MDSKSSAFDKKQTVHPDLFVKLVFEIAVSQKTKTHDQTFEEVVDPNHPLVPAV